MNSEGVNEHGEERTALAPHRVLAYEVFEVKAHGPDWNALHCGFSCAEHDPS